MVSDETLDVITELKLPRYGLARYINPKYKTSANEDILIEKWEKASGHLSGFVRTGLFKRLSSCGNSFVISLKRHLARNEMWLYAISNGLPVPVGSVLESMLDAGDGGITTFEEDNDIDAASGLDSGQAKQDYETLRSKNPTGINWVHAELFIKNLEKDISEDTQILTDLINSYGQVNEKNDSKIQALFGTIKSKYPNQKILIFTEYADTADYVAEGLTKLGLKRVQSVTGNSGIQLNLLESFLHIQIASRQERLFQKKMK